MGLAGSRYPAEFSVSGSFTRLQSRCLPWLGSHLKAWQWKDASPRSPDCWQIFSSSRTAGLRDSVPGWMLAFTSLAHGPPQHSNLFHQRQQERESISKMKVTVLCSQIPKWHSITLATFYQLEVRSYISPHSRRGLHKDVNIKSHNLPKECPRSPLEHGDKKEHGSSGFSCNLDQLNFQENCGLWWKKGL